MVGDIQRGAGDSRPKCTVLLAVDISAAFSAVDHSVLGARVNTDFAVGGTVGRWIESFVADRSQYVAVGAERSKTVRGVSPRESIRAQFWALCSLRCMSQIGQVVDTVGIQHHRYADDLMLYCARTASQLDDLSPPLHQCVVLTPSRYGSIRMCYC